jgi:hypothetical protein
MYYIYQIKLILSSWRTPVPVSHTYPSLTDPSVVPSIGPSLINNNIIHRVYHFNNNNNILYTSKLIDSVTLILPRLLLLIMPIHCSLINIIKSYYYNVIFYSSKLLDSVTFILLRLILINIIISYYI